MLGRHQLLEAEQPFGVVAQRPAAHHDADPPGARPDEAAEQRGGGAACGHVVDADESRTPRTRHVRDQGEDLDAVLDNSMRPQGAARVAPFLDAVHRGWS
jgi:hypothetical protein